MTVSPADLAQLEQAALHQQPSRTRPAWSAEVTDFAAFLKWAADNPFYWNYLQPNTPELNRLARKEKGLMSIPGVTVVNKRKE